MVLWYLVHEHFMLPKAASRDFWDLHSRDTLCSDFATHTVPWQEHRICKDRVLTLHLSMEGLWGKLQTCYHACVTRTYSSSIQVFFFSFTQFSLLLYNDPRKRTASMIYVVQNITLGTFYQPLYSWLDDVRPLLHISCAGSRRLHLLVSLWLESLKEKLPHVRAAFDRYLESSFCYPTRYQNFTLASLAVCILALWDHLRQRAEPKWKV